MNKLNILVFVGETFADEKMNEVVAGVAEAGMEVILHLPKSGIIIGVVNEDLRDAVSKVAGVDHILTETELKEELLQNAVGQ